MASKFANFAQGFFGGANEIQAKNAEEASKKRLLQEQSKLEMDRIRASNMSEWERQAKYIKAQSEELRKNKAFEYTLSSEEKRASREGTSKALEVYYSELEQYSDVLDDPATPEGLKMRIEGRARAKAYDMGADPEEFNNVIGSPSKGSGGVNITNQFGAPGGDLSAPQARDLQDTFLKAYSMSKIGERLNLNIDEDVDWNLKNSRINEDTIGFLPKVQAKVADYDILIPDTLSKILEKKGVKASPEKLDEITEVTRLLNMAAVYSKAATTGEEGAKLTDTERDIMKQQFDILTDEEWFKNPRKTVQSAMTVMQITRDKGIDAEQILRANNIYGLRDAVEYIKSQKTEKEATTGISEATTLDEARELLRQGKTVKIGNKIISPPKEQK